MRRDIYIVVALDTVMALLGCAYLWLIHHVWTGMASIHVAALWALLGIIFTIIAGVMLQRLYVGILGILGFWTLVVFYDWSTSLATLLGVIKASAIVGGSQLAVLVLAWSFGFLIRSHKPVDK